MSDKQCEACHGPANNHERNPRKGEMREPMITFGPMSPVPSEKQNSVCLSCHTDSSRSAWHSSEHRVAQRGTVANMPLRISLVRVAISCMRKTTL
ncbi:hypothetical protein K6U65_22475 [Vibrio vulnificus]|nr:cytochrome c3 family protein [Vibrio vulnificus]MCG6298200.1 hypothetical protein [Vibrio vulnificus]